MRQNISTFYFNPKSETIIIESVIDDVFESVCSTIISNIKKYLGKGSGCIRPILDTVLKQGVLRLFQHGLVWLYKQRKYSRAEKILLVISNQR